MISIGHLAKALDKEPRPNLFKQFISTEQCSSTVLEESEMNAKEKEAYGKFLEDYRMRYF